MVDCLRLLTTRFDCRKISDRKQHPIGVVGGAPGVGKTRALKELIQLTQTFAAEKGIPWFAPVIIIYNDGQPPDIDQTLVNDGAALALRILYFAFRHDLRGATFKTFVKQVPAVIIFQLTPEEALRIIQSVMNARCGCSGAPGEPQGFVYLAVDDTNKLSLIDSTEIFSDVQWPLLLKRSLCQTYSSLLLSLAAQWYHWKRVFESRSLPSSFFGCTCWDGRI